MNSTNSKKKNKKKSKPKLGNSIEIAVGRSWLEHLRQLFSSQRLNAFDFCELFDLIDLVVGGVNLTASIESEYIIPFFSKLCAALNRLSKTDTKKAIVEFQKEPWDFVIVRDGADLLLSIISIDYEMRIVCLDQRVNFESFAFVVRREAQLILDDISSLIGNRGFNAHPEISRLIESLSLGSENITMNESQQISVVETGEHYDFSRNTLGVSFPDFSLTVFFEPNDAFFQYQPEIAFDLHTLLVPGEVQFEFENKSFALGEHVFVTLNTLLKHCHEWMRLFSQSAQFDLEIQRPFHLRLRSSESAPGSWEIGPTGNERTTYEASPARLLNNVDPRSLLESIVSVCTHFSEKVERLNPTMIVNQRFSDFRELTVDLKSYWDELCEKDLFNDEPESFLADFAGLSPTLTAVAAPDFRFDFKKLRAIHPAYQWSFQAKGISFQDVFTNDNRLVVPTQTSVSSLSLESGNIDWEVKTPKASSPIFREKNAFLRVTNGTLTAFDLGTGQISQSVKEDRPVRAMHQYEDTFVFSTEEGIIGRSKSTLEESWFYPIKRKIGADAVTAGPVYSVLSNSGVFHTLNPITGDLLWKVKLPGTVITQPRIYRSRIFVCIQSGSRFKLSSKLAFTGRDAWEVEEEGLFGGELFFSGDYCIFSIESNEGLELIGLCLKIHSVAWRIPVASSRGYYPNLVFSGNRAIAKTNGSETLCFEVDSGTILWRQSPETLLFSQANLNLVIVRDAFFSYSGRIEIRSLDDGSLIRDFGETMIEAKYFNVFNPLAIVTGERGDGIDQDRLVSFTIQHFLAMVEPPEDS